MRTTALERAFSGVQINPGEKLTPLHKRVMRSLERRVKFRQQRRKSKGR